VGGIASPACKSIRLIGMRVASPLRSVKEAYHFGFKWGDKVCRPVGCCLGITGALVSMAVSMAGIMAASVLVMPYVMAGLVAVGLSGTVAWMVGAGASTVLGLSGLSAVFGVVFVGSMTAALTVISSLVTPVASLMKGFLNAIKNRLRKKSLSDTPVPSDVDSKNKRSSSTGRLVKELSCSSSSPTSHERFFPPSSAPIPIVRCPRGSVSRHGLLASSSRANSVPSADASEEETFCPGPKSM